MAVPLTPLDIAIFIASILIVLAIGLWAGRKEDSAKDFYLAGRSVPWWGVAGSIFGTNVSAEHLVGMLGIGYSIGFAQAHFEFLAIGGLLMLAFVFLPLYRGMGLYTLSEYLSKRYDERSGVLYSTFNILTIVIVRMALGFYIGARALSFLLEGTPLALSYEAGIAIFALVTATYTIVGGLKAVIWTDVMQSCLLLAAGIFVAVLVFGQPEIGGLGGLLAQDAALPAADQKFHLYLPPDHPQLPWTGVFTGLMIIHIFYWSTNQFIAQRALAAKSEYHARMGILAAGFLKLLIPFVSIATGVAAGLLFESRLATGELDALPLPDDAFPLLVQMIVPAGYGLVGLITAGLIGAILSSIDSMMNSGATLLTFDFYRRYVNPQASQRQLILVGRVTILVFVGIAACIAAVIYTKDASDNFFLKVPAQMGHIVPGITVAFLGGVFWRRASASGAFWALLVSPFFSFWIEWAYPGWAAGPGIADVFGSQLNFLHRTFVTSAFALAVLAALSWKSRHPAKDVARYIWRVRAGRRRRAFFASEIPWAWLLAASTVYLLVRFA
ncbi:MAG: sodium/solute symporter [Bryobacterales bacterium]|nr:sodium/solute symporter [Bryobacterales bacterium]